MRPRRMMALLTLLLVVSLQVGSTAQARGSVNQITFGQDEGSTQDGAEPGTEEGAPGDSEEDAAGEAEIEPERPWTYMMALLALAGLLPLLGAIGLWYYRFVVVRARAGV